MKSQSLLGSALLTTLLLLLFAHVACAGSATWNLNPTSGDWNTAANWTPVTVPNGLSDTATFAVSNQTEVSSSATTTVDGIVFDPGASAFTITADPLLPMTFSGTGITNNSGVVQNFATHPSTRSNSIGGFAFTNSATAGDATLFTIYGGEAGTYDTPTLFFNSSSASSARFIVKGSTVSGGVATGDLRFEDDSSAANATITLEGANVSGGGPGIVYFDLNSTPGNAHFLVKPGNVANATGGAISIFSSAGNAIVKLASAVQGTGGTVDFFSAASAGTATFTIEGAVGGYPSTVYFRDHSTAGNATLIANGGVQGGGGGMIKFADQSDGVVARIEVFDNGSVDVSDVQHPPRIGIGSIEGNGLVILGTQGRVRPFFVGGNNRSTVFSGTITGEGKASLVKVGSGTLTLSNANTYAGGTEIDGGQLLVSNGTGSGTGTGDVSVATGTLGGRGIIAGKVIIGTGTGGAFLAPGATGTAILTIQNTLAFGSDGTYTCKIDTRRSKSDEVGAAGITIASGAPFVLRQVGNVALAAGTTFTVISNTAATPIAGTFSNLADGATVTIGSNTFQANYEGGDGNDLTLTVVP